MIPKVTRDAIFYRMKQRNISQTELAKELGIARPTLNAILNGKMSITTHEMTILKWYRGICNGSKRN